MEDNRKRKIISALLTIAVVASFVLLALVANTGGRYIAIGIANWVIEMAALSILVHKHLTGKL